MSQKVRRLNYFSVFLYHLTGGRAYAGSTEDQAGILRLTTTGRKSGKQRMVHLMYIRAGSDYVITASNGGSQRHPGWYYNVQGDKPVMIDLKDQQLQVTAKVAEPEQRARLWAELLKTAPMFAGYENRTKRTIPMVILQPITQ